MKELKEEFKLILVVREEYFCNNILNCKNRYFNDMYLIENKDGFLHIYQKIN